MYKGIFLDSFRVTAHFFKVAACVRAQTSYRSIIWARVQGSLPRSLSVLHMCWGDMRVRAQTSCRSTTWARARCWTSGAAAPCRGGCAPWWASSGADGICQCRGAAPSSQPLACLSKVPRPANEPLLPKTKKFFADRPSEESSTLSLCARTRILMRAQKLVVLKALFGLFP